ncbi:MAG: DUF4232 domain-containing protein [Solirubrobacteraceae bacterium]
MRVSAVALSGLMLAACGAASHSGTRSASVASTPQVPTGTASTAQTTTVTTSHTASATTTSTGGAPDPRPCRAVGLALSFLGQQGATGHGELGFGLRNVSGASCRTYGYPGVLFLDRGGAALPTVTTRTTHDFFGVAPLTALVLAPDVSASFRLGVTHGIASSAGCTTAYGLQVIAPDDTATLHVSIPGGAYECGRASVSPLRPGGSAFP